MKHLFYSDDRNCCSYPKGNRFKWINVFEDSLGCTWIEGKEYWGCICWILLDQKQAKYLMRIHEATKSPEFV